MAIQLAKPSDRTKIRPVNGPAKGLFECGNCGGAARWTTTAGWEHMPMSPEEGGAWECPSPDLMSPDAVADAQAEYDAQFDGAFGPAGWQH